ncbi:MAG: hydroxyacid dehydrogenase [Candidatus Omnitrophica bacterium CG11_big_fil_rev_8_21_14_0_20_63_9]|nr:MAG: hydroxyacid dehydrogenase [Candidatus Omnitrophica bacterium CG11_big_fil_rev_8_21_14_0_20_63_9]
MSRPLVYVAVQQFGEDDARARTLLEDAGFEVRHNPFGRRLVSGEMAEVLQGAAAVLAGSEPYDARLLAALPTLRCISRCGVGVDAIDMEAARRLGIAVYTTPDEVLEPMAQMTVAMILALARHLPLYLSEARSGQWRKHTGVLLSEWTIGLVGFGRIGQAVARALQAFGPRLLIADPLADPAALPPRIEARSLASLLAEADLVSLHVARPAAEGVLIGRQELAAMRPGSRLVNTARGYLVDEAALYDALQSGHLSAAALDVFATEPYTGPLAKLPQVLCTPHVGSLTRASRSAMELRCVRHVVEHFSARHEEKATWAGRAS